MDDKKAERQRKMEQVKRFIDHQISQAMKASYISGKETHLTYPKVTSGWMDFSRSTR